MKKSDFFWVGFSDLMTNLFFIMLVLFVVTVASLQIKMKDNVDLIKGLKEKQEENEKLIAKLKFSQTDNVRIINENKKLIKDLEKTKNDAIIENKRLNKLLKLEQLFAPLSESSDFIYLPKCKKFIAKDLTAIEIFKPYETKIKPQYKKTTINVGRKIESFLKNLNNRYPDMSYLLVIEGNMANNPVQLQKKDDNWGYRQSYNRALAVYNLWIHNNIVFRNYNVEVLICGSGFNGLCRDPVERNNKRFSIQIIPKIEDTSKDK